MARKADRYFYLRVVVLDDAKNWLCGHCPEGNLVAQWAIERDTDHWREPGHPATGRLPGNISDFREHLKRLALIAEGERAALEASNG
jgi:hypothetical protein